MLKIILIVIVSIVAVVVLVAVWLLYFVKYIKLKKNSRLTEEQLKAILCGALATEIGEYHNTLETGTSAKRIKYLLTKQWKILTKADLLECADYLLNGEDADEINIVYRERAVYGNDGVKLYDRLGRVRTVKPLNLQLTYSCILLAEQKLALDGIIRRGEKIKSSLAWTLCRVIWLMRSGYTANLIDETYAWSVINECYARLKAMYRDWEELAIDFFAGMFIYWGDGVETRYHADIFRLKKLQTQKSSPWLKYSLN
jgi:uncharacterized protein YneF (UPF0154 family)